MCVCVCVCVYVYVCVCVCVCKICMSITSLFLIIVAFVQLKTPDFTKHEADVSKLMSGIYMCDLFYVLETIP